MRQPELDRSPPVERWLLCCQPGAIMSLRRGKDSASKWLVLERASHSNLWLQQAAS
jgi:hypothetical protein